VNQRGPLSRLYIRAAIYRMPQTIAARNSSAAEHSSYSHEMVPLMQRTLGEHIEIKLARGAFQFQGRS
jgi:hypothetical protein